MTLHDLIFSDEKTKKLSRHSIFWLSWFFYIACTQLRNQTPEEIGVKTFIIYQIGVSANRVILQMLFCYPLIYLIIPRFLSKKSYKELITLIVIYLVCLYSVTYIDYFYIWSDPTSPILFDLPGVKPLSDFQLKYFSAYSNLHCTGTFVAASIILATKYYKNWFKKQRENEVLIYQNSEAELQLLKAQVHPHFLFNTLNNIYSLMLDDSPKAITVLNELSGMLLYMTNEGTDSFVPLNNEIKMLNDYIGLEKIRYGTRLDMIVDIKQDQEGSLLIAPLLLIPFVENSFKHGASKTMDKTKIHIYISTEKEWLEFRICNDVHPIIEREDERNKIGLKNVKKRLQILYPKTHSLYVQSLNGVFTVNMKIFLGNKNSETFNSNFKTNSLIPAYAQ